MRRFWCGLAAAAVVGLTGVAAEAATISRTYAFTMTDFTGINSPAPVDTVSGSFTVTFDPSVAVYDQTEGLTVHSLSLPVGGTFAFSFTPFGMLSFGAILHPVFDEVAGMTWGTNDFYVGFFQPLNDTPIAPTMGYTRAGIQDSWGTQTGTVYGHAAVPEPATWALMILGFGAAGAALRRSTLAVA